MPYSSRGGKYPHTPKSTPIFVAGKTKPIGQVSNSVFTKTVAASKHFLQRPRAIALDLQGLLDAQRAGAAQVEINDCETSIVYRAPVNLVYEHGFRFNRGFGDQIALGIEYWTVNGQVSEHERNQAIQQVKQMQAGQLSLFGGVG